MKWTRAGVFICAVLATFWSFLFVSAAQAAEAPAEPTVRVIFYLDWGFVGRPVSLELNGGKTVVSWEAGDLVAPTVLMVEIEKDTAALAPANVSFGEEVVHLTWADPYNLSARGVKVTNKDGCIAGQWTVCSLYREDSGIWKEAAGGRAYGHARVRMGTKKGSYMQSGAASWYKYKNCRCAASPDFPKGTRVRVTSLLTGKYTVVRINDWGPERDKFPERVIDLDVVAFKEFAPLGAGVINVKVEPIAASDPDYAIADAMPPSQLAQTAPAIPKAETVVSATAPAPAASGWSY